MATQLQYFDQCVFFFLTADGKDGVLKHESVYQKRRLFFFMKAWKISYQKGIS